VISQGKLRGSMEESDFERELGELEQQIDMIITESKSSPCPIPLHVRPSKVHTELSISHAQKLTSHQHLQPTDLFYKQIMISHF
jgi:hypothetical protein